MNPLDVRTVMISYIISNAINAIVIFLLWRQNRRRFAGIGFWLADYLMQFVTVVLISLRGVVPDSVSALLSNGLAIAGTILFYMGLERFVGKRGPQLQNGFLLAVFLAAHAYFLFITPSLAARNILFSLGLLAISIQCAWLMLRRVGPELQPITRGVGLVFAGYCLVSVIRLFADLSTPTGNDFFHSSIYDTLAIMTYQMLFIALTFNVFLMVNRRLFADLNRDIAGRRQAEDVLRRSEENFREVFDNTAQGIFIVDVLENGKFRIGNRNKAEEIISGARREDAQERLLEDAYPEEIAQTLRADFIRCLEAGAPIALEESVELPAGRRHFHIALAPVRDESGRIYRIIGSRLDISEGKRIEEILRLRLNLWEYAANHTVDELMQKALDEIGELTGSPVGFYHFVQEDQKSLSLQAWSTRTLEEFCQAEGRGMHYGIDQAGVWADCIRQRKPVIHNDYAALPNRRGMPAGHAVVVRELVVPTLRAGRIVSVLGIGNKPSEYDEKDVEQISSIADIVWVIVDHKRTEEEIHHLQAQLREMAIHDPLTGLYNRHYMNETLKRELARAAREKYPVSFVMIDIDHFKRVNDAFGHKAGDAALQGLAAQLRKNSRAGDIIFRYGGEEFLAILPKVKAELALQIAEKWRKGFLESTMLLEYGGVKVTISSGIATFPLHGNTSADLIANADQALYQAKAAGRNQSAIWKKAARKSGR